MFYKVYNMFYLSPIRSKYTANTQQKYSNLYRPKSEQIYKIVYLGPDLKRVQHCRENKNKLVEKSAMQNKLVSYSVRFLKTTFILDTEWVFDSLFQFSVVRNYYQHKRRVKMIMISYFDANESVSAYTKPTVLPEW